MFAVKVEFGSESDFQFEVEFEFEFLVQFIKMRTVPSPYQALWQEYDRVYVYMYIYIYI